MPLLDFDQLQQLADEIPEAVSIAVAGAEDHTVLEALHIASRRGWVRPILVGRAVEMERIARQCGVDLSQFEIVDSEDVAKTAVFKMRSGETRLLMKGQVSTPKLLNALLDEQHGLRTERVISQVVLMEINSARRRFLLADTGICIQPTLDQKIDILRGTVAVAQTLGAQTPRVALMAATEMVTEKMPETIDAQQIQELAQASEFADCHVYGPISFDMAYSAEAAEKKRENSPVAGDAEIMIFPNLLSANLTVKAIMYTADCRYGGVLIGVSCPVVFMSRADDVGTRINSIALAMNLLGTFEK